jgi:hypothetical protein
MRRFWMAVAVLLVSAACRSQEVAVFTNHRSLVVQSHRVQGEWTYFRIGNGEMAVLSKEVLSVKKESVQPAPATYAAPAAPPRPAPPPQVPANREPWRQNVAQPNVPSLPPMVDEPPVPPSPDDPMMRDSGPDDEEDEDEEEQPEKPVMAPEVQRKPGMPTPTPFGKPPQPPPGTQNNGGQ